MPPIAKHALIICAENNLKINCYFDFIELEKIKIRKKFFSDKCRLKCENFNKRHCCPPHAPDFNDYLKNHNAFLILLMTLNLNQLPSSEFEEYRKIEFGNLIIKEKTETIMRFMEIFLKEKSLSLGECASCVSCPKETGGPCLYPEKMRYSLGSLGVDCDTLAKELFGVPLLWYKNGKAPKYTSGISALPLKKEGADRKKITRALKGKLGAIS